MFESLGLAERTLTDDAIAELDLLRKLGLLVPRWSAADEEYPLHPAVGFERLAARRQQAIDAMVSTLRHDQQAASHFVADYSEFVRQSNVADVEVLEGRDKAYQRMQHFQPTKSVWAILPPPCVAPSHEPHESPNIPFLERGVDARTLMAESVLNITAMRRHFRYLLGFGSQFRTMPTVPRSWSSSMGSLWSWGSILTTRPLARWCTTAER